MDFIPGFLQGVARVLISYPFDYIRVHLQKNKYESTKDFLKKNKSSIKDLYRGVKYPLSIVPIDRAITFKLYEDFNKKSYNPMFSSLIASSLTCLYNVPLQSINTNYILQNEKRGYFNYVRDIVKNYKSNYLFKSYSTEYSRLVLGSTLYMGIYGNIRNITPDHYLYHMLNGSITNVLTWTIIYPLDTIRVEHQTNNSTLKNTIIHKYKNQGFKSFYKGISLVYIRTLPSASVGMFVYELSKKMIEKN